LIELSDEGVYGEEYLIGVLVERLI